MATSKPEDTSIVRISNKFNEAFNKFQDQIRERAFHLSLDRGHGEEDSLADWLEAQSELSKPIHLKIKENKKNLVVEGELKGFAPGEIEVEVKDNLLQVFGSHIEMEKGKKSGSRSTTSSKVAFYQSLPISIEVDLDKSHAKLFKNGKLKITLPKKAQTK